MLYIWDGVEQGSSNSEVAQSRDCCIRNTLQNWKPTVYLVSRTKKLLLQRGKHLVRVACDYIWLRNSYLSTSPKTISSDPDKHTASHTL